MRLLLAFMMVLSVLNSAEARTKNRATTPSRSQSQVPATPQTPPTEEAKIEAAVDLRRLLRVRTTEHPKAKGYLK